MIYDLIIFEAPYLFNYHLWQSDIARLLNQPLNCNIKMMLYNTEIIPNKNSLIVMIYRNSLENIYIYIQLYK